MTGKKKSNDDGSGGGGQSAEVRRPIDGQLVAAIASQVATPFYLYFEERIQESIDRFRDLAGPETQMRFASMANDNPCLLRKLKSAGFGVFVNSPKHLDLAYECGFENEDIVFAATGISASVLQDADPEKDPG